MTNQIDSDLLDAPTVEIDAEELERLLQECDLRNMTDEFARAVIRSLAFSDYHRAQCEEEWPNEAIVRWYVESNDMEVQTAIDLLGRQEALVEYVFATRNYEVSL